jgi:hypothetical protein
VELRDPQDIPVNAAQQRNLSRGRYRIMVATIDMRPGGNHFAPYRIQCFINGAEVGSLNFESFSARDGVLMAYRNGLIPAKQIYAPFPAFEAAEVFLNSGQVTLEIIVQDIAGNSRSTVTRMAVN